MAQKGRILIYTVITTIFVFMCTMPVSAISTVLKKDSTGSEVAELQKNLIKLGYLDSEATGFYGDLTVQAVKAVQGKNGETADGVAGSNTIALIEKLIEKTFASSTTSASLKPGAENSDVKLLQSKLKKLGYLATEPTGYFGSLTSEAVTKFQKANGLDVDGFAGKATIALLDKLTAEAPEKTQSVASATVAASTGAGASLKEGASGASVSLLQEDLYALGYLKVEPTGYYGTLTVDAVKAIQQRYGYTQDGVAGEKTKNLISSKLVAGETAPKSAGTAAKATANGNDAKTASASDFKIKWNDNAENILSLGTTAVVYDIATGRSFKIKRTYGHNHADCETASAADTKIMKEIYDGTWSWDRRAVLVTVGDTVMAASMAGMPHAGLDDYAANKYVSSRSGGFGRGTNLDAVKDNNMNGHFDLHFLGSRTHATGSLDSKHQAMVKKAAEWAAANL